MLKRSFFFLQRFCSTYQTVNVDQAKLSKFQSKNFADKVRLTLVAGSGGNGCITFYADKRVRKGQPDGGCGGKGGDIVLEAHKSVYDLSHFRRKTVQGNDGGTGGPRGKDGKNGGKTMLRVPCGTLVYEIEVNEDENTMQKTQKKHFLADLDENNCNLIVAKGGEKGKGNKRFPYLKEDYKYGKQGQTKLIYLELKTLADVGLVGFPNIGKSTFLAAVSRAMPKIANYQFTTLKPSVGYVKFVDDFQMTIADIPGIIEGAHQNKGLGLQFLRHIQRTKVLIYMLDITNQDPVLQYKKLENELTQYAKQKFKQKQKVIIFNKRDCLKNSQQVFKFYASKISLPSFLISAKQGDGVGQALVEIRKIMEKQRQKQRIAKQEQALKPK